MSEQRSTAGSVRVINFDESTVTIGASDLTIGRVKLTDGTNVASVLALADHNPLTVAIVDGSGDQITSFGGGSQYVEDAPAAVNPTGTVLNLVRNDARSGSLTTDDGDNISARGTNSGELYVKHVDSIPVTGTGTFAVQATEATLDAALIAQEATTSSVKGLTAFGAVTTNAPSYTTGKSDALSLDPSGLLRVSLKDTPANSNKFLVTADAISIAAAQTLATVTTVSTVTAVTSITNTVATAEVAPTTIYMGKKTVTTAGTRVTLASSQAVKSVTIKALASNTNKIYVGDTTVASTNGFQLAAGESISMDIANLTTVNLDSDTNGEGVTYIGVN